MTRIFITQLIPEAALNMLREVAEVDVYPYTDRMISREELINHLKKADILYTLGDVTIDAEVMDANPNLQMIAAMTMEPHVIDVKAATARGIPVTNIPYHTTDTTADLAMSLILGLAMRLLEADRATRTGAFRQEQSMFFLTTNFSGKTFGIIGLGRIGQAVARRAKGFGVRTLYADPVQFDEKLEKELGVERVPLDELLRVSDFITVHASHNYNPGTLHLIGEREFSLMKPTAFFINTSRGRVIDERALIAALKTGKIAGAGLDVYYYEPPYSDPCPSPELLKMDNVILTPHIGSAAVETRHKMSMDAARNVIAFLKGERPPFLKNPEAYEVRARKAEVATQ